MKILNMLGVEAISYVDEENNSDGAAVYDVVEGKSTVYLIEGRGVRQESANSLLTSVNR